MTNEIAKLILGLYFLIIIVTLFILYKINKDKEIGIYLYISEFISMIGCFILVIPEDNLFTASFSKDVYIIELIVNICVLIIINFITYLIRSKKKNKSQ